VHVEVTVVAHGVGGSYTRWQRKPPAHRVYMAEHAGGWTTVTVWHDEAEVVRWEDGAMGPNATPFAHDVDVADLTDDVAQQLWAAVDTDLRSEYGRGDA